MSQATSSIMLRTGVQPVIFLVEQQQRGTFVALYGVSGEISANEKEETKYMMIIFVNKQKWFDTGLKNVYVLLKIPNRRFHRRTSVFFNVRIISKLKAQMSIQIYSKCAKKKK